MTFRQQNLATYLAAVFTLLSIWFGCVFAGYLSEQQHIDTSSIGTGTYSAGFIGNYAGHLTGGQAVNELLHEQISHHDDAESHDFSDDHSASTLHESLGTLGDHLQEHNFPADVESEHYKSDDDDDGATASDYAEEMSASELHEEVKSLGHDDEVGELGHHEQHYDHDDFESKPVPGIDHGKGAFSYSTLYESKEDEKHY